MKKNFLPLMLITLISLFKSANAQDITITPQSSQNVTCHGGSDGYIIVNVVENNQYYSINGYYWSNGAITQNISNLTAGTYTLTVTDTWYESSTYTKTITEPDAFGANFITVGDTGTGANHTGTAKPEITGGTPPYSYLWSTMATTDSISGLANGPYSLTVTDSKVCISQTFNFTVGAVATGIENISYNSNFAIYPNPAIDYLSVSIPSSSIIELEVRDILGHTVYIQSVIGNQMMIDVSHLPQGIYFALLKTADGDASVRKFIKE